MNNYIEDPCRLNDLNAWRNFKEFVRQTRKNSKEYGIRAEYIELMRIRNKIAILRTERREQETRGNFQDAFKFLESIQQNYEDSIAIVEIIQEKLQDT